MTAFALACALLAQLTPTVTDPSPMAANAPYVPAAGKSGYVRVTLPPGLAKHQVVHVRHGTEIFRVQNSRVTWSDAHGTHVVTVPAAMGVDRSGDGVVVEAIGGSRRFPVGADVTPAAGQYTLVFYAPGQQRSPLLRYSGPDYVVP